MMPENMSIGGQCPVHYQPLGACCQPVVRYVSPPSPEEAERKRLADLIRAFVGREYCRACQLRWNAGNRRNCRRCRTSHALAYAIEADAVTDHMLHQGNLAASPEPQGDKR